MIAFDVDGAADADRDLDDEESGIDPDVALGITLPLGRLVLFDALEYRDEASVGAGLRLEL